MFHLIDQVEQGDPSRSIVNRSSGGSLSGPLVHTNIRYGERNGWILFDRIEAGEVAKPFGFIEPEVWQLERDRLEGELREAKRTIEYLTENLSVPLAEVIDLVAERAKRRPETQGEVA